LRGVSRQVVPTHLFKHLFFRAGSDKAALTWRNFLPRAHSVAMTLVATVNSDAIRETFREWNAERDSLDAELGESLVALEAYQLHLDTWHQQLARERDDLQNAREQFERDRLSAEKSHSESSAATITELHAAREKITALTTLLLSRTEELRTLDNRRAESQTELELARARERELKAALDEHKRSVDDERSQWAEELKHLREVVERQLEAPAIEEAIAAVELPVPLPQESPAPAAPTNKTPSGGAQPQPRDNPLLGSIVEQFGKLRQQRAVERQANNRQR
jgi:DNA repair exonuclease SbcCD ATPase subunit